MWCCITPKGKLLPSTIGATRHTSKRRLLDPLQQKYHGLVSSNFVKWEQRGFKCVRVKIKTI